MDTQALVTPVDVSLGEKMTKVLLDDAKTDLRAALWWFDEPAQEMRFIVATPLYESQGPQKTYAHLYSVLNLPANATFALWAVSPTHPIVSTLASVLGDKNSHSQYQNSYVSGLYISLAYVFFVRPSPKSDSTS